MYHNHFKKDLKVIFNGIKIFIISISFVIGVSFIIYQVLVVRPKKQEKARIERKIKEKDIISYGINSIQIVTNMDWQVVRAARGDGWATISRIYVNSKLIDPDTLFMKEEFIFKHCGVYYYLYGDKYVGGVGHHDNGGDSIVHRFSDICRYEVYDGAKQVISRFTSSYFKKDLIEMYKDQLPECK